MKMVCEAGRAVLNDLHGNNSTFCTGYASKEQKRRDGNHQVAIDTVEAIMKTAIVLAAGAAVYCIALGNIVMTQAQMLLQLVA